MNQKKLNTPVEHPELYREHVSKSNLFIKQERNQVNNSFRLRGSIAAKFLYIISIVPRGKPVHAP